MNWPELAVIAIACALSLVLALGAVLIARNPVPPLSPLAARVLAGAMLLAATTLPVATAFWTHQTVVVTAASR